jgi:hypothetical protein
LPVAGRLVIVAYGNDQDITFENNAHATSTSAILTPEVQQAVWFPGALVCVRTGGDSTAGSLAVLEYISTTSAADETIRR